MPRRPRFVLLILWGLGAALATRWTPVARAETRTPANRTLLIVRSNVAQAHVSLDGILAGPVNAPINADAGTVLVEVAAKGYVTHKARVPVTANSENAITINLERLQPTAPPRPTVVARKSPTRVKASAKPS